MSTKALAGIVVVLVVAGGAYWFYTDYQKEGATAQGSKSMEGQQVGSEVMPGNDPAMNGTWKSNEDAKFTREFNADGTVTDRYEGDAGATANGTWTTVDPAKEANIDVPLQYLAGMTVVKIHFPEGDYYFSINSLSATNLKMTYLGGRGNVLTFTKVN